MLLFGPSGHTSFLSLQANREEFLNLVHPVCRQVGGKYDLPSLSQLHYEGESIRGVAADNDVTLKMDFYAQYETKKRATARGGQEVRFSLPSLGTATVSGGKMLAKSLDFTTEGGAGKLNASAPL